jgi:hypothetical protein
MIIADRLLESHFYGGVQQQSTPAILMMSANARREPE